MNSMAKLAVLALCSTLVVGQHLKFAWTMASTVPVKVKITHNNLDTRDQTNTGTNISTKLFKDGIALMTHNDYFEIPLIPGDTYIPMVNMDTSSSNTTYYLRPVKVDSGFQEMGVYCKKCVVLIQRRVDFAAATPTWKRYMLWVLPFHESEASEWRVNNRFLCVDHTESSFGFKGLRVSSPGGNTAIGEYGCIKNEDDTVAQTTVSFAKNPNLTKFKQFYKNFNALPGFSFSFVGGLAEPTPVTEAEALIGAQPGLEVAYPFKSFTLGASERFNGCFVLNSNIVAPVIHWDTSGKGVSVKTSRRILL